MNKITEMYICGPDGQRVDCRAMDTLMVHWSDGTKMEIAQAVNERMVVSCYALNGLVIPTHGEQHFDSIYVNPKEHVHRV